MINRIKPKSEFSRNILTLMTGTTIAQAIPIAISPILTRIYTPEDFGLFALYMAIASVVSVIATGRYELAIMLPKKDSDAINIVVSSIIISFFVSFISLVIVFIFNSKITNLIGNQEISKWLYFIPITILLTGIYQSFNYWSNRKKQYTRLAVSRVSQSGLTATTNIAMGLNNFGGSGLILSSILGQGLATSILAKMIWKEDAYRIIQIKRLKIFALLRKYIDFPKINMFHAFINDAKNLIFNVLLVKFYDTFLLGQFYMLNKILLLPSGLIGNSISQVLFREYSEKYNKKVDFSKDVFIIMVKLFSFALLPFLIIVLYGKLIFSFVFGNDWIIAGELARAYALYILFHFVAAPISIIPLIVKKQKAAFYWNLIGSIIYVLSMVVGYYLFSNLSDTLILLSIIMSIFFIFYFRWVYTISKLT